MKNWRQLVKQRIHTSGLMVGRGKKSQISRDFQGQIRGKNGRFREKFAGFSRPVSLKNDWLKEWPISWELPEQISLESDWFCVDSRNVFNETRRSYCIYSGFIPYFTSKLIEHDINNKRIRILKLHLPFNLLRRVSSLSNCTLFASPSKFCLRRFFIFLTSEPRFSAL